MDGRVPDFHQKSIQKNFNDYLSKLIIEIPQLLGSIHKILILKSQDEDYLKDQAIAKLENRLKEGYIQ